jgi:hypothetical protein
MLILLTSLKMYVEMGKGLFAASHWLNICMILTSVALWQLKG